MEIHLIHFLQNYLNISEHVIRSYTQSLCLYFARRKKFEQECVQKSDASGYVTSQYFSGRGRVCSGVIISSDVISRSGMQFYFSRRVAINTSCLNRAESANARYLECAPAVRVRFDYFLRTTKTCPRMLHNRTPRVNRSYDIHLTQIPRSLDLWSAKFSGQL